MKFSELFKKSIKKVSKRLKDLFELIMSQDKFTMISNKYRYSIKYKIRKFFYYGKAFYCPCCERFLRKFAPFGIPKRDDAECPFCYVMERHRILFLFLKNKTNFFTEKLKVLDFGPEFYLEKIFKSMSNLSYISADLNPEYAMLQMDISNIKFDDNTFDLIICISVIEHVIEDRKALNELFRVLKPGGRAYINVPINYDLKETIELLKEDQKTYHDKDFHARDYGVDFLDHLRNTGFNVETIRYKQQINPYRINLYGLMNCEDTIYISSKPKTKDEKNNNYFKIFQ